MVIQRVPKAIYTILKSGNWEIGKLQFSNPSRSEETKFQNSFWTAICKIVRNEIMPWYNGDYPPSYKNQPPELRAKAVEIANSLLENGAPEGIAIATGLKRAREFFENKKAEEKKDISRDWSKTEGSRRP